MTPNQRRRTMSRLNPFANYTANRTDRGDTGVLLITSSRLCHLSLLELNPLFYLKLLLINKFPSHGVCGSVSIKRNIFIAINNKIHVRSDTYDSHASSVSHIASLT